MIFCGFPLDPPQQFYGFPVVRALELDAALQMGSQKKSQASGASKSVCRNKTPKHKTLPQRKQNSRIIKSYMDG